MITRTAIPAVLSLSLLPALVHAQIFQRATFLPNFNHLANDIVDTRDCGFATIGSLGSGDTAVLSAVDFNRFDSDGAFIGNRTYSIPGAQNAGYTLVQSIGDDFLLAAESNSVPGFGKWILRTDPLGNVLWSRIYTGTPFINAPQRVLGVSVGELIDKSIASVNRVQNFANVPFGGVLTRTNANGVPIFTRVYNSTLPGAGPIITDFSDFKQLRTPAAQPDLIVVGNSPSPSGGLYRAVAVRFDLNGNAVWSRSYTHPTTNIFADSVVVLPDESILFCGRRGAFVLGQQDPAAMIVARIDPATGNLLWSREFDRFQPGFQAIRYSPTDKLVMIAGTIPASGSVIRGASILKIDPASGAFAGAQVYGSFAAGSINTGTGITFFDPWGGYSLVGTTNDIAAANALLMVKTYTTLESGCRESPYTPANEPISLTIANFPLQITEATASTFPQTTTSPLTKLQKDACFNKRCVGDLNGDGLVDDADFVIFVAAYDALLCPTDPRFTCCPADFNADGFVDDTDFVLFSAAYNDLLCP